jgi:acetyl esterase/lipase
MSQVDPELVAPLEGFLKAVGGEFSVRDIPAIRAAMKRLSASMAASLPPFEGVTTQDRTVPGPDAEAPEVMVRIYQPSEQSEPLPALLWMHGGGYVLGDLDGDDPIAKVLVKEVGCIVVSVDYRLAPEHPFPAAVEDCYAALKWLAQNAATLGVDPDSVAIGGVSAGGGLAACLGLLVRDRGEMKVAFQLLQAPMIDDRTFVQASADVADTLFWTRENNLLAWSAYLGKEPGGDDTSPYASASRATDLTRLPPAYISVGSIDLFLSENIEYAQRLIAAGVPTEVHVYPGGYHGFELTAPTSAVGAQSLADRSRALKRALGK